MLIKIHFFLISVFTLSGSELVFPHNKRRLGSSHGPAELTMHCVYFGLHQALLLPPQRLNSSHAMLCPLPNRLQSSVTLKTNKWAKNELNEWIYLSY